MLTAELQIFPLVVLFEYQINWEQSANLTLHKSIYKFTRKILPLIGQSIYLLSLY